MNLNVLTRGDGFARPVDPPQDRERCVGRGPLPSRVPGRDGVLLSEGGDAFLHPVTLGVALGLL